VRFFERLLTGLDIRQLLAPAERRSTLILLGGTLVLTLHRYFSGAPPAPSGAPFVFGPRAMFVVTFLCFGALPGLVVKFGFREKLSDFGIRLGDWRTGLVSVGVLFPIIFFALLLPGSRDAALRAFYPLDRTIGASAASFLAFEGLRAVLYYSAWEFFYRGFWLFGLRQRLGDAPALGIQVVASCLWHIGMPLGEILSAIPGGIVFGLLSLRTGSILWPFLLHTLIGAGTDLLIVAF